MTRLLLVLSVLAALGGCNSSCDFRDSGEDRCQERTGAQGNALFGTTCSAVGGVQASGTCPDEDLIVGGCLISELAGDVTDWYYEPMTTAEVEETCISDGGEFVSP